ncbi:MAG: CRISPR-associated helicase Cas3' [Candidatus Sumerlaeia bacterium]|nr:CRISPR-associated helicase Cas3' [Candidatus Sumerlaeia bacterium]
MTNETVQRGGESGRTGEAEWLAHSESRSGGPPEPLAEHLRRVEAFAAEFAASFDAADEARLAALLHDAGKASDLFLKRLRGQAKGLDHWTPGALLAWDLFKARGLGAAVAIQGHHVGLQSGLVASVREAAANPKPLPQGLTLTESNPGVVRERLEQDGVTLPPVAESSIYSVATPPVAAMLDLRMLFSALVDADFLATEAHFEGESNSRPVGPSLDAQRALSLLMRFIEEQVRRASDAGTDVNRLREDLLRVCLERAGQPPGLFTLSAPTGSGKTLAMLAFALHHARRHGLRRVVLVLPFLSIIEQTAGICRKIFETELGPLYTLEHHSLSDVSRDDGGHEDNEDQVRLQARLLAENWDAPLIVTTSVQCLESLFANRPAPCRKLHRLAKSVILFDEVQTLPLELVVPTLAALSRLAERFGSTVVFATATQPAFGGLHEKVREWCPAGWQPREIAPSETRLFGRIRRTELDWREIATKRTRTWEKLAEALRKERQALVIVNLRRHARWLVDLLRGDDGVFHLSTAMCAAHREAVLRQVRDRLASGPEVPCRLVATQCVEAGVDLDFPAVYRALGPLEAIAQAAGRCNRNGRRTKSGRVTVFQPELRSGEKGLCPPGGYEQATDVTRGVILEQPDRADIEDPALFQAYYQRLYGLTRGTEIPRELRAALDNRFFPDVAKEYRLIRQDTVSVLVPYDPEAFDSLKARLEKGGRLTAAWIRAARRHAIGIERWQIERGDIARFLQPTPLGYRTESKDWFVCLTPDAYDPVVGWNPPTGAESWVL